MQVQRVLEPVFARLGVYFRGHNCRCYPNRCRQMQCPILSEYLYELKFSSLLPQLVWED
jgi:hypothetical protein